MYSYCRPTNDDIRAFLPENCEVLIAELARLNNTSNVLYTLWRTMDGELPYQEREAVYSRYRAASDAASAYQKQIVSAVIAAVAKNHLDKLTQKLSVWLGQIMQGQPASFCILEMMHLFQDLPDSEKYDTPETRWFLVELLNRYAKIPKSYGMSAIGRYLSGTGKQKDNPGAGLFSVDNGFKGAQVKLIAVMVTESCFAPFGGIEYQGEYSDTDRTDEEREELWNSGGAYSATTGTRDVDAIQRAVTILTERGLKAPEKLGGQRKPTKPHVPKKWKVGDLVRKSNYRDLPVVDVIVRNGKHQIHGDVLVLELNPTFRDMKNGKGSFYGGPYNIPLGEGIEFVIANHAYYRYEPGHWGDPPDYERRISTAGDVESTYRNYQDRTDPMHEKSVPVFRVKRVPATN